MSDLLGTGASALRTFQRAIATTSHNIANVETEGFSRQRLSLETQSPARGGDGNHRGNGVRVAGIERIASDFAVTRIHDTTTAHAREATHHDLAIRLDGLFADGALDPTSRFAAFFSSLEDASLDPASTTAREMVLDAGEAVADRLRTLQTQLEQVGGEVDDRRRASVSRVNEMAGAIADLNGRLVETGKGGRAQLSSDLLDRRDLLASRLAEEVDIETVIQDDGALNVMIGDGVPLVVGRQARALRAVADTTRPGRSDIELGIGSAWQSVGARLHGGELGGLEAFESSTLEPAMQRLGRLTHAFAAAVNEAHVQGVRPDGTAGDDWFSVGPPVARAASANAGSGELTASVVDAGQLGATDYRLRFDGSGWRITRTSDGDMTAVAGLPTTLDGLEIGSTGTPVAGDTFLVSATRSSASTLDSTLIDAQTLALAEAGAGPGANGNARLLAGLGRQPLVDGATFAGDIGVIAGAIGSTTATLATRSGALESMRNDAIDRRDSLSGVNLDEEAIALTRHEQAYQAAARIISTADALFQTVLGAVSR